MFQTMLVTKLQYSTKPLTCSEIKEKRRGFAASMSNAGAKDAPLLGNDEDGKNPKEAARVLRTFLTMCVSMSLNMGVVTTVIAFAGADFPDIGVYSVGVLYAFYVMSAMCLGPLMQALFGLKKCLVLGLVQYCVYLLVYLVAELIGPGHTAANAVVLVGSAIGGIGRG